MSDPLEQNSNGEGRPRGRAEHRERAFLSSRLAVPTAGGGASPGSLDIDEPSAGALWRRLVNEHRSRQSMGRIEADRSTESGGPKRPSSPPRPKRKRVR